MPKKGIVRINQGRLLPLWLRLIIAGFLFLWMLYANFLMSEGIAIFVSIGLAAPVLPVWNACFLLEINNKSKIYLEGYWFAGFRMGKWKNFSKINEIKIVEKDEARHLRRGSNMKNYSAVVVFENRDQIYLIGGNSSEKLKERLKEINDKLELERSN